jgi:hypothetical protein
MKLAVTMGQAYHESLPRELRALGGRVSRVEREATEVTVYASFAKLDARAVQNKLWAVWPACWIQVRELFGKGDRMTPLVGPTADDVLGRTYRFKQSDGYTITGVHDVQAVAYDPERGIKLVGVGFEPAWVDFFTWRRLHDAGILEDC